MWLVKNEIKMALLDCVGPPFHYQLQQRKVLEFSYTHE